MDEILADARAAAERRRAASTSQLPPSLREYIARSESSLVSVDPTEVFVRRTCEVFKPESADKVVEAAVSLLVTALRRPTWRKYVGPIVSAVDAGCPFAVAYLNARLHRDAPLKLATPSPTQRLLSVAVGTVIDVSQDGRNVREVTVDEVQYDRYGGIAPPAPGHVFVGARVTLRALVDGQPSDALHWSIASDRGAGTPVFFSMRDEWKIGRLGYGTLRQGQVRSGWVVFEVPEPMQQVVVTYLGDFYARAPIFEARTPCCA